MPPISCDPIDAETNVSALDALLTFIPAVGLVPAAAMVLLAVVYVLPLRAWTATACLSGSVVCAGAVVTLLQVSRPRLRILGSSLVAVLSGLLLGWLYTNASLGAAPMAGLPFPRVTRIGAVALEDGTRTASGRAAFDAQLSRVAGSGGRSASASGRVTVFVSGDLQIAAGQVVELGGNLELGADGRSAFFFANSSDATLSGWAGPLYRARASIRRGVEAACRTGRAGPDSLFTALFLGIRERDSTREYDLFRRAGAAHIMALSGFHLGLIAYLVLLLLRPAFGRRAASLVSMIPITLYVVLVGPRPSLLRAYVVYGLLVLSGTFHLRLRSIDALGAAFLVLSVLMPASTQEVSFRLSFLALGGVLVIGPQVSRFLSRWVPPIVALPVGASAGAQLGTAALSASVFGTVYPVGLISSVLLTPLVTAFMWTGVARLILLCLPYSAATYALREAVTQAALWTYEILLRLGTGFAAIPGGGIHVRGAWALAVSGACVLIWVLRSSYRLTCHGVRFGSRNTADPASARADAEEALRPELSREPGNS